MRRRLASVGTTQIVSRMVRAVRRTRFPPAGAGLAWLRNLYGVPAGSRARYRAGTRPGCAASRTPACLTAPSPHKTSRCYMTRRADFCRRVTLYTREIRRGGRKDTRLWPKLYMIFASSFVTCLGYMCSFGLRFYPPRFVVVLKPMVATAEKVIEQIKIVGGGKLRHKCWNMTFHEKC